MGTSLSVNTTIDNFKYIFNKIQTEYGEQFLNNYVEQIQSLQPQNEQPQNEQPHSEQPHNNISYSCLDRENEILKQFNNFPPGLDNMIANYDICDFKKNETIKFNTVISMDNNRRAYWPHDHITSVGTIFQLNNDLMVTCTFEGAINIWDPISGQCIKEIKGIEEQLKNDYMRAQEMLLYQLSDEILMLKCRSIHSQDCYSIYVISINSGKIKKIINDEKLRYRCIFPISSNEFITSLYVEKKWLHSYIEKYRIDNNINDIGNIKLTKSEIVKLKLNIYFMHLQSDKKTLIVYGKGTEFKDQYYHLMKVDITTKKIIESTKFEDLNNYSYSGIPQMIGNDLLVSVTLPNQLTGWKKFTQKLVNCDIFKAQKHIFNKIDQQIYKVFKLQNDIYMIATIVTYDPQYKPQEQGITIYIVHFPTQTIIQKINENTPEDIRDVYIHKNGFMTLSSRFEINVYDCT